MLKTLSQCFFRYSMINCMLESPDESFEDGAHKRHQIHFKLLSKFLSMERKQTAQCFFRYSMINCMLESPDESFEDGAHKRHQIHFKLLSKFLSMERKQTAHQKVFLALGWQTGQTWFRALLKRTEVRLLCAQNTKSGEGVTLPPRIYCFCSHLEEEIFVNTHHGIHTKGVKSFEVGLKTKRRRRTI